MADNVFQTLPVPSADGTGAPVSIASQGLKSFVIGGDFVGTVIIDIGINGVFAPFFTVDKAGQLLNVPIVAEEARVRVVNHQSGQAVVIVGGNPAVNQIGTLVVPTSDGVGAALDTSVFGAEKTFIVGGVFDGLVTFEVAEDASGPWAPIGAIDQPNNFLSCNVVARFVRARATRFESGLATVHIGAADIAIGDGSVVTKVMRWNVQNPTADQIIPIPGDAMPSDNYVVLASQSSLIGGFVNLAASDVTVSDRTTTEFRLQSSVAFPAGSFVDLVIMDRDPADDFTGPGTPGWTPLPDSGTDPNAPIGRSNHTLTKLADGRVLVVGGWTDTSGTAFTGTCRIWDPASSTWSVTGSLAVPRANHSSVLLPNGRVLTIGGNSAGGVEASCELYNPSTGLWTAAAPLPAPRQDSMTTYVITTGPNAGNVLQACGGTGIGAASDSNIYDVGLNTWGSNAIATAQFRTHADVQVPDGRVILFGGQGAGAISACSIWDPATNTWSAGTAMPNPRRSHGSALLPSGQVILIAGSSTSGPTTEIATTDIYDPIGNTYAAGPVLSAVKIGMAVTPLNNGTVLVTGGSPGFPTDSLITEIFTETAPGVGSFAIDDPIPSALNAANAGVAAAKNYALMDSSRGVITMGGLSLTPVAVINTVLNYQ